MKETHESASSYDTGGGVDEGLRDMIGAEGILAVLPKFHSAKEYSSTRTSPMFNSLSQVWVAAVSGSNLVDINRVHRNFYFDISSSDPVEDYLQFQGAGNVEETPQASVPVIPPEVLSFCMKEEILNYVSVATETVKRNFQQVEDSELVVEEDPETGEKWVLVSINVHGDVEEVLNQYEDYTEDWVSGVPWPQRDKDKSTFIQHCLTNGSTGIPDTRIRTG